MKKVCPSCDTKNEADSRFCESCGTPLPQSTDSAQTPYPQTVAAMPPFLKKEPPPPAEEPIPATFIIPLEEEAAPNAPPPPPPSQPEAAPNTIVLPEPGGRLDFVNEQSIHLVGHKEYFVGRTDPANQWYPIVDLTPHDGETGGVSRRHARFFVQESTLHLEDLGSTNGTFLNEQRITAHTPYPLNNADQLRFGRVAATYYANVAEE